MRYNNYHKHTTYSSIFTPDTHIQPIEYLKRAKELGHNTYFTTEHGFGGDIFETVSLSQQEEFQGIKPIFALEGYIVPNPLEKDNSNYHIMLIARTDNARKKLNKINSRANREGYYYKPRIFLEDLLQLDKDDIYITSACVAGFLRDEIGFKEIFLPLYRHFDKSLLLETQSHNENIQKKHNQNILRIAKEYDLKIIHANDSHYIYPDEAKHRLEYLKGKGITYGEEDNFILDYPDYETVIERYKKQGILNEKQTQQALENTLLFDDCETIKLDNTIKMPNIYPDLTPQERYNKLENIVYNNWKQEKKNIDESKHGEYEDAIRFELDIIKETNEEIHTADYFLLNERIVDIAVNKYNGILTKSGRGCFTEDALVHTRETLKSIKDIKVGDEVITESGVFNKVVNTMKYDIEEELVQIKHIYGTDKYNPSICTLDHKILINRDDNINWIQAKDIIKGDYVCVPKINKQNAINNQKPSERIKEDDNYWYLPIKEIVFLPKQKVTVYDIEVENEHSYLLNNMIVHNSGVSFYINKLLGFTGVDRLGLNVPMYPTRFLSKTRLLESQSLPDFDFNTANPEPFIKATKDLLGENGCYWMIAYGTMKESEAFRNTCRNMELDHKEYNEIAKNIDTYKDDKKWKDIIKHSEKFVGSIVSASPHPCFLEDELVMTDKGYKKIARINKGDFVLTHTNQYKKVISTMENMSEDVYEIKAMGIPSTKVTGNHPYYVREMTKKYNPKTQTVSRFFSNPIWKDVKDLSKNDYLGIAINQKNVIPRGKSLPYDVEEFWWIIGRYIGDGWYKNERKNNKQLGEYNTIICTGKHEIKQVTDVLDKLDGYFHYFVTEESTVFRINILCKELWDFVKQFGKGASNKRLTNTIFDLPTNLLNAFIKGYISSDGYKQKDGLYSITTVSRELAYGISSCINKAYKRPTAITYHAKKDSFINKRKIIGKNQYIIKFREFPVKRTSIL